MCNLIDAASTALQIPSLQVGKSPARDCGKQLPTLGTLRRSPNHFLSLKQPNLCLTVAPTPSMQLCLVTQPTCVCGGVQYCKPLPAPSPVLARCFDPQNVATA